MRRLLTISYCFPPVASPEAYVSAKLMGALQNFQIDTISANTDLFRNREDRSLDDYVSTRFHRIIRLTAPWLLRKVMLSPRLPLRPDRYVLLTRLALRQALALGPAGYDALLTRSQYHSSHLVGLALKERHPDLPWIASFSDPWTSGIYDRHVPFLTAYSARRERAVLEKADALIFPTTEMRDFFVSLHQDLNIAGRATVIPHGFDPSLYGQQAPTPPDSVIRIRIFGSFYGPRSPEPLLQAVNLLIEKAERPDFVVEIYGQNSPVLTDAIARHSGLAGIVRHMGELDHVSALHAMAKADILTMVDAPMPPPSIFMPSKLADYIGANRPIFAVTPEGAAADIVRRIGGSVAPPDDSAQIAETLGRLIQGVRNNRQSPVVEQAARGDFDVRMLAYRLESTINSAIAACRPA